MGTLNLDKIFNPKAVAIVGASDEAGTVSHVLMQNLIDLNYKGKIFPMNIHKTEIFGFKAYPSLEHIPEPVDLAVIATLEKTVPDIVEQCGKAGANGSGHYISKIQGNRRRTAEHGATSTDGTRHRRAHVGKLAKPIYRMRQA